MRKANRSQLHSSTLSPLRREADWGHCCHGRILWGLLGAFCWYLVTHIIPAGRESKHIPSVGALIFVSNPFDKFLVSKIVSLLHFRGLGHCLMPSDSPVIWGTSNHSFNMYAYVRALNSKTLILFSGWKVPSVPLSKGGQVFITYSENARKVLLGKCLPH